MASVQSQVQQDWNNREFINVFTSSIKQITEFLNAFDIMSARTRLAMLNERRLTIHYQYCSNAIPTLSTLSTVDCILDLELKHYCNTLENLEENVHRLYIHLPQYL